MGNLTVLQTIGVSMGTDPAYFWANLYLSKHECDFMGKLIKQGIARAKSFHGTFRFIDDLCTFHDEKELQNIIQRNLPQGTVTKVRTLWISR